MDKLLTVPQAAEILGLYHETVREMTRDGRLKKIIVGKRAVRIDPKDLQEYIDSNRREGEEGEVRPDKTKGQR